jgi:diguanylate cyclase (GGDEF)-like protein
MYMQQDIDASIREHNALRDRSEHDALTDLFNRTKLDDMRRAEYRGLETCGVMFFDINNLKKTNDTLGHEAGDELICLAAESVRSITNRRIMAYRYGGDELLVVAANVTREEFEQSMRLWGIRLESLNKTARNKCSMALGSVWDESGEDIDELIKRADALMYENKKLMKAGRGE